MDSALETRDLSKRFGSVAALDGLSLDVPLGGVFGVLGPNGAGKSTLFRIALGLVRPTQGEARLMGASVRSPTTLRRIGAMIETPRFHPYLSARQTLTMLARLSGLRAAPVPTWLARVGLSEAADRPVHGFSVGMKQRLGVAAALIAGPEVVILDEPTSGMDPAGILEMRTLIRELADKDGVTVILASHQLPEVQRLCDQVAILDRGKLIRQGRVSELIGGEARLRLLATPIDQVLAKLGERGARDGEAALAAIPRDEAPALIRALAAEGVDIVEARWVGADLESVYLRQTGDARAQ